MVFRSAAVVVQLAVWLSCISGCEFAPSASAQPEYERPEPVRVTMPAAERATVVPSSARPCPADMAVMEDTCVDRYEAHLVVEDGHGNSARHPEYERPKPGVRYVAKSQAGVKPQAYISSIEAARACENAGKRLCSVTEWFDACRGPERTTYPYGERFEKGRCNVGQKHVLARLYGKNPMSWTYDSFNDPELIKQGYLAPAGDFEECASGYGTHDMVGNLHEWVADRVDNSLPNKIPLTPPIRRSVRIKRGFGIFMGGFFSTGSQHGRGCEFTTIAHEPKYHDYSTGFRCCKDAER
jgi:formylglycine-generating enzyme required for sulfatase activity